MAERAASRTASRCPGSAVRREGVALAERRGARGEEEEVDMEMWGKQAGSEEARARRSGLAG
jgi:hypothetical protein